MLSLTTDSESTNKGNHFYSSYATPISSSKQSQIQNAASRLVSYTTQVSKPQFNSKQNITSSCVFTTTSLVSEEIDAEIKTDEEEKPFSVDSSGTVYADNATSYYSSQFNIYSNDSTFASTYRISSVQNATSITLLGSITSSVLVIADSTLSFLDSTIKVSTETTLTFATVVASSQSSNTNSIVYETKPHSSDSKKDTSKYSKTKSILWKSSYSTVGGADTTVSKATKSPNNIKSSSSIIYTSYAVSSSRNLNSVSLLPEETTRSIQHPTSSRSTSDSASSNDYSLQIPSLKSSEERNSKSYMLIQPTYGKTSTSTPELYISGSLSMRASKSVPEKVMSGSSINAVDSASASPSLVNTKIVIQNTNTVTKQSPSSALYTSSQKDKSESGVPQKMESINDNGRTVLKSKTATSSLEDPLGTSPVNVNSYPEETGIIDLKTSVTKSKRTKPSSNQYSIRSRHKTEKDSNIMEPSEAIKSKEMNSERIGPISLYQNTELSSTQKLLEMKTAAGIVSGSVVVPLSSSTIIIIPIGSLEPPKSLQVPALNII